jgi:hypothetical protein
MMAVLWNSEVPNLTEASKSFLVAVARFPEWVVAVGLTVLLATEGRIAVKAATLIVIVEIAGLVQSLAADSRTAAARSSAETGLASRMRCSSTPSLAEFVPCSFLFQGILRCCGLFRDTGNRSGDLLGCGSGGLRFLFLSLFLFD